ncbi:MAG: ATP-grasp domain-containing protein [Ruminococcus sp.]|uniref:ATP-grasp domain-containing protein n=1 Tax=Ruminococcus sp. TaxID=41978 RepID=UPI00287318C1|nr:ATP-grasp domain-containing protein [Ruminococcus sp.]MBQ3285197.1 ATP-grasp domain-containing protein [Ruminococcus sp.]
MKKKLAIIGANDSITLLILKAKNLGYETHVFAWQCGDPGEFAADYFYPISVSEKEEILEKCREIGICGICSITSDFAVPTVAYVARHLGLPCNPERTDVVARDKYEMRKAFQEYGGIYCPRFFETNGDLQALDLSKLHFPIIVKPTDRWSSKGVTRVDSMDEIAHAIKVACKESLKGKAIVEEFMDGPEYSAECIVFHRKVSILAFTQKITTGYPHYIEKGHKQPADLSDYQKSVAKKAIDRAIKALDITDSAAHVEFRFLDNGEIGIIEIGARMGGDCIGTDLTPISTGMDYIKMVIDVACGNEPDFSIIMEPKSVQVNFIISKDDMNYYKTVNHDGIIRKSEFDLNFDMLVTDSSNRHGFYIFCL